MLLLRSFLCDPPTFFLTGCEFGLMTARRNGLYWNRLKGDGMKARLTLRAGQEGTRKLVEQYTVELIEEDVPWFPHQGRVSRHTVLRDLYRCR
jgi:hypothetical protein